MYLFCCMISSLLGYKHHKVKVAQSCLTLCDPMDCMVHGILQARTLEWVAFPSPGDLPNPGTEPRSPALQVNSLPAEPQGKPKHHKGRDYRPSFNVAYQLQRQQPIVCSFNIY